MSTTAEESPPRRGPRRPAPHRLGPHRAHHRRGSVDPDLEVIAKAVAQVAEQNESKPAHLRRGVIARGLGRSYGDTAQNAGGLVVDMTALHRIHSHRPRHPPRRRRRRRQPRPADEGGPAVRAVGSGAARHPAGHHRRRHRLRHPRQEPPRGGQLRQPRRARWTCSPPTARSDAHAEAAADPKLFWATVGGMGLTGIILRATIEMTPDRDGVLHRRRRRHPDLDETIALHSDGSEANYDVLERVVRRDQPRRRSWAARRSRAARSPSSTSCRSQAAAATRSSSTRRSLLTFPDVFPNGLANKFTLHDRSASCGTGSRAHTATRFRT